MKGKGCLASPMSTPKGAGKQAPGGIWNGHPTWGPKMDKGPSGVDCKFMEDPKWNPAKIDSPLSGTTLKNPKKGR